MSRQYRTISEQHHFDLAIQKFGSLDGLLGIFKALPLDTDVNQVLTFGLNLTLEDTENSLGLLFDANNSYFSTGKDVLIGVGAYSDDYSEAY